MLILICENGIVPRGWLLRRKNADPRVFQLNLIYLIPKRLGEFGELKPLKPRSPVTL